MSTVNDNIFPRLCGNEIHCSLSHQYRIEFTVGDQPVKEFQMIERHFFNNKCLKSFEFNFGFCVPNSRNTCEQIYEFPELIQTESKSTISLIPEYLISSFTTETKLIANPYQTKSDSFYFVDGELVMHHRAEYAYNSS